MRIMAVAVASLALLGGCGTTQGDRGLSGALIGGGIGLIGGGGGVVVGALVGAGVGMLTDNSQINLGTPIWNK
jgi:osmotically inducible lipoprotein OsmB